MSMLLAMVLAGFPLASVAPAQLLEPEQPSAAEREQKFQQLSQEANALQRQFRLIKNVVQFAKPAVVHIEASKSEAANINFPSPRFTEEAGSGVIIHLNDKYYVLTNRHVIDEASPGTIKINLWDGRQIHPLKVWSDSGTDVAVMEIASRSLVPARLGNSDQVEIGDFVLAMGSPFGLSHSVTFGIISAKGRRDLNLGSSTVKFQDFLQTDAAINPGNSGGPLINLRGEVIGINTAIASNSGGNEGIGFSIPINIVKLIARQLIEQGSVSRAFLGVKLEDDFGSEAAAKLGLPRKMGAFVTEITDASPAEAAKIQVGDVILQFDGVRIDDINHLINLVGLRPVGKKIAVVVFREGKTMTIQVKLGDRSRFPSSP